MPFTPPPPPTGHDPRGFAVGVLSNRQLRRGGLRLRQWRWRYGSPADRANPFPDHVALEGRFMSLDGVVDGFFPGDHAGCLCSVEPVYQREGEGRALPRQSVEG